MKTENTISQQLSVWGEDLQVSDLPESTRNKVGDILIDFCGLCIAARHSDYVNAVRNSAEPGDMTLIGHDEKTTASSAAIINGTAAHGEDFDDTFEGGPVHCGVVTVPALLAAAEQYQLTSDAVVLGIAAGNELLCRLALSLPKGIHKAGFHPTAVLGAFASAFGVAVACKANARTIANSLGIAGSMASGIIEYLGDGSWTKRMHPGWAAQSGLRAYAMAKGGFSGPAQVFEGTHGAFNAFAHSIQAQPEHLFNKLGEVFVSDIISFKPYPCGTMVQPYIDCAIQSRVEDINLSEIGSIMCETAEGIVHRLWEPLEIKRNPPTPYAAKFSVPFGIALGLVRNQAGLEDFSDVAITDTDLLDVANKVSYKIDPNNPYPSAYTGHVQIKFKNGQEIEIRQDYIRGGQDMPLTHDEIIEKFLSNCRYGGYSNADKILAVCDQLGKMQGDYKLIRELRDGN